MGNQIIKRNNEIQNGDALQPLAGSEGAELMTPREIAEAIYDMGFRLSNSLETRLTDTDEEIHLRNVCAPMLGAYWADGTARDVERFFEIFGIEENIDIAEHLYHLSGNEELREFHEERARQRLVEGVAGASPLVTEEFINGFGLKNCYFAMLHVGADPGVIATEEMREAVKEALEATRSNTDIEYIIRYSHLILKDLLVTVGVVKAILSRSDQFAHYERIYGHEHQNTLSQFLEEVKKLYPELVNKVLAELDEEKVYGIHDSDYLDIMGNALKEPIAQMKYPGRFTSLYDFKDYVGFLNRLTSSEMSVQIVSDEEVYLVSEDGKVKVRLPFPVFKDSSSGYETYEFATKENLQRSLELIQGQIAYKKKELTQLEESADDLEQRLLKYV